MGKYKSRVTPTNAYTVLHDSGTALIHTRHCDFVEDNPYKKITKTLHRYIMEIEDSTIHIDHKNGDTKDNTRKNLRLATRNQNRQNSIKRKTCKSQYKGVSLSRSGRWMSYIYKDMVKYDLGRFDDERIAALAYNKKAIELFGEFANLNKLDIDVDTNLNLLLKNDRPHGACLLSYNDVREVIDLWNTGEKQKDIAEKFNVSRVVIANITIGKTWKQLQYLNKRGSKRIV